MPSPAAALAAASKSPPRLWLGPRFVLASGSAGRAALLESVGLTFEIDPARLDERSIEQDFLGRGGEPALLAARLARAKALEVCDRNPDALCLGADQTLTLDGHALHKPQDMAAAESHLKLLAGRTHKLTSAFCFARNGEALCESADEAFLTMRPIDERAVNVYLAFAGEAALSSVGAYQVESLGAHLFEKIDGAHATIVGLPLLQILAWLRSQGYLAL
jgi:septum formation protein